MNILLTKKLTASKKKEFIYRDKSYDWEDNYVKLIKDNIEAKWTYDKDNRCCLCDDKPINDIVLDDIYKMFEKSGLNILNKNNIRKALTVICKENEFSNKQKAKIQQNEEHKNLPDKLFKFINDNFGSNLSYNISNGQTYWQNQIIKKDDLNNIIFQIKQENIFKSTTSSLLKTYINKVAQLHQFKERYLISTDNINDNWNILTDVDPEKWMDYLQFDSKNNLKHNVFNYACVMTFHPQFKGKLSFNSFDKIESLKKYDTEFGEIVNKPIDDDVYALIKAQIEQIFGDYNIKHLDTALSVVLQNNSFHEIKEKFKDIYEAGWDGIPRMHEIMIKYFGCEDRPEIREMTEIMLIGSIKRILEEKPNEGAVFDYMGILFGKQGTGKTKFMTRLYFGDRYTTINPPVEDDQKFTDLSNRAWLILFDEMKGIDKADMPTVKSRITEQGINCRLSYARRSKYYPRHNIFWGNTNYRGVLRDEGEERRFLCFECLNETQHEATWWEENYTDYDIDQIWAESLKLYYEKYENKVPEISRQTREYNYQVQIKHKVWVEDSRTDLELKEILNYKKYQYPVYEPSQWRIWMKHLDQLKLNGTTEGKYELKFINCKWVLSRLPRKQEWITGMVETMGWKKIQVNDDIFGKEEYYIRNDVTFDDIKNEYISYYSHDEEYKIDVGGLPF